MDVVTLLTNIHEIILKSPNNSGKRISSVNPRTGALIKNVLWFLAVIWGCVDTMNKTISAIPKEFAINRLRVLPILADTLEISTQTTTIECILKMLQDITFGIRVTLVEPFLEKLLQTIVDIIIGENTMQISVDAKPQYNEVRSSASWPIRSSVNVFIDISGGEKGGTVSSDQYLLQ